MSEQATTSTTTSTSRYDFLHPGEFWNDLFIGDLETLYNESDTFLSLIKKVVDTSIHPKFKPEYIFTVDNACDEFMINKMVDYDTKHKNILHFTKIDKLYINRHGVITMFDMPMMNYEYCKTLIELIYMADDEEVIDFVLREFWEAADKYDREQLCVYGYMSLNLDNVLHIFTLTELKWEWRWKRIYELMVYYVVLFNKLKHLALKRKPYLITYTHRSLKKSVEMLKHILVASEDKLYSKLGRPPMIRMVALLSMDEEVKAHPMKLFERYSCDDMKRALRYIETYHIIDYANGNNGSWKRDSKL